MERLQVRKSIWIAASQEAVWKALTDPSQLQVWYAPGCRWEMPSLKVGSTVKFFNTETDIQSATIERAVHARELGFLWLTDPSMPRVRLLNRFLLEEEGDGTRLEITQEGYEALPSEEQAKWVSQDEGAYAAVAEALKAYVEKSAT